MTGGKFCEVNRRRRSRRGIREIFPQSFDRVGLLMHQCFAKHRPGFWLNQVPFGSVPFIGIPSLSAASGRFPVADFEEPNMSNVTLIGLGAMGSAFAKALRTGGHATTVWNRTQSGIDRAVSIIQICSIEPLIRVTEKTTLLQSLKCFAKLHSGIKITGTRTGWSRAADARVYEQYL